MVSPEIAAQGEREVVERTRPMEPASATAATSNAALANKVIGITPTKTWSVINCFSGLATLRGSAPATQDCHTQELGGKEEVVVEVVGLAAGNMEQASVSSATGRFLENPTNVEQSVVQLWFMKVFISPRYGHFARECREEENRSSLSTLFCVSWIMMMFDTHCKNKWGLNGSVRRCYKCHESGHIAKDCSKEDVCYVCNKVFCSGNYDETGFGT